MTVSQTRTAIWGSLHLKQEKKKKRSNVFPVRFGMILATLNPILIWPISIWRRESIIWPGFTTSWRQNWNRDFRIYFSTWALLSRFRKNTEILTMHFKNTKSLPRKKKEPALRN